MKCLLGKKIGMTRIYDSAGTAQPVTVLEAGPCTVTQVKTQTKDGYNAIQLSYGRRRKVSQPASGHLKPSGVTSSRFLREFQLPKSQTEITIGQVYDVSMFEPGDRVTVRGRGKGKGFAGVVKRHGFAGGPASHGSDFHRTPGSIGGRWPQRVVKGRRMAGRMGGQSVSVSGLEIIRIDRERNLLAVKGAVPGPRRALVLISLSKETYDTATD